MINSLKSNVIFQGSLFKLFVSAIVLFFLGDVVRKISLYFEWEFIRYSTLSKVIVLCIFLVFFIFNFKIYLKDKNAVKVLKWIFILIITFIIGQVCLNDTIQQPLNLFLNIEYLTKYLYFPIIILLFSSLKYNIDYLKKIIFIFEIVFLINAISILIGFCFDVSVLQTYGIERVGYMGIFSRSGQTSFYFIMFILFYYSLIINGKTKINIIKFIFFVTVSTLIGTKRIYLFLILLSFHYFFFQQGYRKWNTYKILVLTSLIGFYFKKKLIEIFNEFFYVFQKIYYENGFFSSLTSFRNELFFNIINEFIISSWSFVNFIFGGPSFQNYIFITGMDFFDLYLFFGMIGLIVYYKLYKALIDFKIQGTFFYFFFFVLVIISFFSSAFIYDPYVNLLFFILIGYYSNQSYKFVV
ncbi:oligosaccharide repeat unit polymerase [Bizionia argentinensis JUB59]|uniref:Oligosaccharide repeat unit polymerase n=1 Tax=Bizionia argentinensis JUB59 TaxID=1046627 RepID=G2EES8_9FLAO|nr:oligosaccharide repeat unit polymerase [Bizionia argentinensis]EGV43058.1 oligosaccharide repeat unit polymerase [Bizionia argentinensis JUB59]